ncbi:DoxX family protein [Streptomyces sp. PLAI1-29]|uniref:DoxX family protein n=2 Tax=Streptomyces zingiberis TaxID=2053010 RepID=A0ABX1BQP7_9ACTN|nr:DoxX family protein [Streptomyces zingiberis]
MPAPARFTRVGAVPVAGRRAPAGWAGRPAAPAAAAPGLARTAALPVLPDAGLPDPPPAGLRLPGPGGPFPTGPGVPPSAPGAPAARRAPGEPALPGAGTGPAAAEGSGAGSGGTAPDDLTSTQLLPRVGPDGDARHRSAAPGAGGQGPGGPASPLLGGIRPVRGAYDDHDPGDDSSASASTSAGSYPSDGTYSSHSSHYDADGTHGGEAQPPGPYGRGPADATALLPAAVAHPGRAGYAPDPPHGAGDPYRADDPYGSPFPYAEPAGTTGPDGPDEDEGEDDGADARRSGKPRGARAGAEGVRHAYYPDRRMNLGVVLLPLRILLGFAAVYAGMGKLCDPVYFDGTERGSLVHWLRSLEPSGLAAPLHDFALAHPVGSGLTVAFLQIVVGVLTVCGLWQRLAAALGVLLSAALLLTVSWRGAAGYAVPDLLYLAAWSPLVIAGAPVYSLDARLVGEAWRRLGPRVEVRELRRRVLRRGSVMAAVVVGGSLVTGAVLGGAVRSTDLTTVPSRPGETPRNHLPGSPLPRESTADDPSVADGETDPGPRDEEGPVDPSAAPSTGEAPDAARRNEPGGTEPSRGTAPGSGTGGPRPTAAPVPPPSGSGPADDGDGGSGWDDGADDGGSPGGGSGGSDGGSGGSDGSSGGRGALGGLLG